MARRMRSGTLVGPGICRKCRPDGWEFSFNIATPREGQRREIRATSNFAYNIRKRGSVKKISCCAAMRKYVFLTLYMPCACALEHLQASVKESFALKKIVYNIFYDS